jgi:Bacteriophage head to tail connecting protein
MDASSAVYEQMGPSLLSMQPVTSAKFLQRTDDDWEIIFDHLESSMAAMRNWRYSFWTHWAKLAEFFKPRRYHWLVVANRMNRGSAINDSIVDGTATLALNTCASGMWAGLTNPSRQWFKIEPQLPNVNLDGEGKAWLDGMSETIYMVLSKSNFYSIMAQAFEDLPLFGTAPVLIYEDFIDIIRCYLPCAGEYFLKAGARLSIDTHAREFVFTVQQIVEMFGVEKCPEDVVLLWNQGGGALSQEFVLGHMIEPNFELSTRSGKRSIKVVAGGFTYRELYWFRGRKTAQPLSRRGFRSKPFCCFLWSRVSNDPYGRSPCMDALGDTKQVQKETLRKAEFIEKLVRPPMGANPELKNEPSSIIPGMITYMSTEGGKKGFWPLFEVQPQALAPLTQDIEKVSQRIDKALFVDVFMAITQMEGVQPRNELELTKRDLERLQKLGPVIDLVEGELASAIHRVIDICQRRRLFKPMPQSLRGVALKVSFETIMRLAQRSAGSVAMKDTFATMGELSSAAKAAGVPDPIRVINLDKAARKYADLNNFPADCFFTDDEVQQHDQAREQAMQKAQAPQQAMAGVTAAKTLSETQVPGGNALGALLGNQGGQGGQGGQGV